jgi:hypothetical protein
VFHCLVAVVAVIQFKATTAQQTMQVQAALEQQTAFQARLSLMQVAVVAVLMVVQQVQLQELVAQAVVVQVQHLEQQQVEQ